MKLDTANDIVEWAEDGMIRGEWLPSEEFEQTAEYLAYCVRVTAIVEREAAERTGMQPAYHDRKLQRECQYILAEAKEQGK